MSKYIHNILQRHSFYLIASKDTAEYFQSAFLSKCQGWNQIAILWIWSWKKSFNL